MRHRQLIEDMLRIVIQPFRSETLQDKRTVWRRVKNAYIRGSAKSYSGKCASNASISTVLRQGSPRFHRAMAQSIQHCRTYSSIENRPRVALTSTSKEPADQAAG